MRPTWNLRGSQKKIETRLSYALSHWNIETQKSNARAKEGEEEI